MAPELEARWRVAAIQVSGMTCGACSSAVECSLARLDGVRGATVSCVSGEARVHYDASKAQSDYLLQAVRDVGFAATLSREDACASAMGKGDMSVELKVSGMTCGACSGTVESLLQGLPGVTRATVSLILSRAYVLCDPARQPPQALVDQIEGVGFEAEVVCSTVAEALHGQALLHVSASCAGAQVEVAARELHGVLCCQTMASGHQRITYNPYAVGGRALLKRLGAALSADCEVAWANAGAENEQLEGHSRHIADLRRDVLRAVPPAAAIFLLVILLPCCGIDHRHMGVLSTQMHHGVDVLTAVILTLATPVQFVFGRRFHAAAYAAVKRSSPNMDVLVSVASNTAYVYSTGLLLFCLLMPEGSSSHELVRATSHFLTMGPILIAVVLVGKHMEAHAKLKAMEALTDIPSNLPATAVLCAGSGDSVTPVELVEIGDVLRVYAGSRIPVDGVMCSQTSAHVDESLLTGESRPVSKMEGDMLFGGTVCLSGGCLLRVSKVGGDTTLGQMVKLVQDAQASKASVQRVADSVARVFVPLVVGLSALTFVVWTFLVFTEAVEVPTDRDMGMGTHQMIGMAGSSAPGSLKLLFAMKFGIAVLMIACPCAMGLATPMAVMVSTCLAAKRGCLVKSAEALELSAKLDVVVLDKTGTITEGSPSIRAAACCVEAARPLEEAWRAVRAAAAARPGAGCGRPRARAQTSVPTVQLIGSPEDNPPAGSDRAREVQECLWWVLGNLESASDHPIAKCILSAVQTIPGLPPISTPSSFEVIVGRGVRCNIDQLGGVTARVGNLHFLTETSREPVTPAARALLDWAGAMQDRGQTVVLLQVSGRPFGAVSLQDPVRDDAAWVVEYLKTTVGADVWLCTGDNTATAQSIAQQVGIDHIVAEALPSVKSELVQKLQRPARPGGAPKTVCFVGDGMNDSPALAQADVGLAIGVGAHVAVEAADVALVRSELSDCATFLALSRATFRTILLNFFWAFCFNIMCLPMAAGLFYPRVYIPPLVAGLGMALSSLLVICSSLLLGRFRPPRAPRGYASLGSELEMAPLARSGHAAEEQASRQTDAYVLGRRGATYQDLV